MTFTINIVPIPFLGDIIFCKIAVCSGLTMLFNWSWPGRITNSLIRSALATDDNMEVVIRAMYFMVDCSTELLSC